MSFILYRLGTFFDLQEWYFYAFKKASESKIYRYIWIKLAWILSVKKSVKRQNWMLVMRYIQQLFKLKIL